MYSLIGGVNLKIGNFTFNRVISASIKKSTRLLSNTAIIELPLTAVFESNRTLSIAKEIKRGDKVEISLGYNGKLANEFTGFVEKITDDEKTVITCEDSMFLFRKPVENKMFKDATLKDILNYIISGSGISLNGEVPEINFESFLLKNVSGIQALQKIKDNYGVLVYLDNDNKLHAGLSYTYNAGAVEYNLQKNVSKNDLAYKIEEELKYKIKAISLLKNNKKIEIEVGDNDGELRTVHFNNITDEAKIKELALQEIEKYKYTGYRGSLTSFGWPIAKIGMTATMKDNNYPARQGNYYVEAVETKWSSSGFSRQVELGVKL